MADALIVGAAPCDIAPLKRLYTCANWDCVIAVDGGYAYLQALQIQPSIAVGDFDSLGFVPDDVPVRRYAPEKDASDMELAFTLVKERGFDNVFVFGAFGGRLDHTLSNLAVFARASEEGCRVIAADDMQAVAFITGAASFTIPSAASGVVSVIALCDAAYGVTEHGLYYPLVNATLTNRVSLGLSNELIGKEATVSLESGTIAIFYPLPLLVGAS